MENKNFKIISDGVLENETLNDKEKEIAQKILNDLEGTLVIRATSILKFCLKAILYTRINKQSFLLSKNEESSLSSHEILVQKEPRNMNFNTFTGEKLNEVCPHCWIKHKPYNCGYAKCPGYRLRLLEIIGQ